MFNSSTSLTTREIQIKTTMKDHHTPTRMAMIKNSDNSQVLERMWKKLDSSYIADGNIKWFGRSGKQFGRLYKSINM